MCQELIARYLVGYALHRLIPELLCELLRVSRVVTEQTYISLFTVSSEIQFHHTWANFVEEKRRKKSHPVK